jgi:hypothetical protein
MTEKVINIPKPRTDAQRAAARANGAKSKGPTTEDGKARSALNAVRHGLLAGSLILRTESQPKFLAILNGYLDEYQPEGQTENNLVEDIAAAQWMKERCWVLTTALLDITMDQMEQEIAEGFNDIDNGTRTALAFLRQADQGAGLVLLNRYAARHSREWHRAIDKLRAIQKERREAANSPLATRRTPLEESSNEPEPAQTPEPSTTSESELATSHQPLATEATTYCPKPANLPPQPYGSDPLPSPKLEKEDNLDTCD